MSDGHDDDNETSGFVSIAPEPSRGVFSFSVLGAAVGTGLVATGCVLWLEPPLSWGGAVAASLIGGVIAAVLAGVPQRQGEAALLRERAAREEERKTWGAAVVDLESLRRQINLATLALRGRKDPLVELPELRVGALHDLLEASRDVGVAGPVVSRIAVDEAELVGDADRIPGFLQNAPLEAVEAAPPPAPPPAAAPAFDPRVAREAVETVDGLIQALERLGEEIEAMPEATSGAAGASAGSGGIGSPAQLVDAVVQTAANGIEDLAAGLMRANELATVAERVTNRATLLALNAQLEATRSGGEAMGAIAEETRRLSEYAREATDTISRLAEEIEAKVGETITAIHATSEDAKAGLASLSTGAPAPAAPIDTSRAIEAVVAALDRAYDLRDRLAGKGGAPAQPESPQSAPSRAAHTQSAPAPAARAQAPAGAPAVPAPSGADVTWSEPDTAWADAVESLSPEQRQILERLQPELRRGQEGRS